MQISDVVRSSVICTEEMPLTEVFELMGKNNCKCIPVVESYAHKVPIGSITEHDICLQLINKHRDPRWLTAANVMNANISKIKDTAKIDICLNLMQKRKLEQIFVVDDKGIFCGTLNRTDLESANKKWQTKKLDVQVTRQKPYVSSPDTIF
jgi:predicted transcriptional regulator